MPDSRRELVINTGPLIALVAAVGDLSVLKDLYARVLVPKEVCDELTVENTSKFAVPEFEAAIWLEKKATELKLTPLLCALLDVGEASVIQLAQDEGISTVCIDETVGRRVARMSGLQVTGSLGVLLRA